MLDTFMILFLMSHCNPQSHLDIDDFVPNERLQEDTDESHEPVLHVPILDGVACLDAVADIQVHELCRQLHCSRQSVAPVVNYCLLQFILLKYIIHSIVHRIIYHLIKVNI